MVCQHHSRDPSLEFQILFHHRISCGAVEYLNLTILTIAQSTQQYLSSCMSLLSATEPDFSTVGSPLIFIWRKLLRKENSRLLVGQRMSSKTGSAISSFKQTSLCRDNSSLTHTRCVLFYRERPQGFSSSQRPELRKCQGPSPTFQPQNH